MTPQFWFCQICGVFGLPLLELSAFVHTFGDWAGNRFIRKFNFLLETWDRNIHNLFSYPDESVREAPNEIQPNPQLSPAVVEEHRRLFQAWLKANGKKPNSILITEVKKHIIEVLQGQKSKDPSDKTFFRYNACYGLLKLGNKEYLYLKKDEHKFKVDQTIDIEKVVRVVTEEEVFDVLFETHQELLHSCRQKMEKKLDEKFANVPRACLEEFLKLCPVCIEGTQRISKWEGIKPIVTKWFNSRAQVDFLDFQSHPDDGIWGSYRFIRTMGWSFVYYFLCRTKQPWRLQRSSFLSLPFKVHQQSCSPTMVVNLWTVFWTNWKHFGQISSKSMVDHGINNNIVNCRAV